MRRRRGTRDAFGRPAPEALDEPAHDTELPRSSTDDLVLRTVPRVLRVVFIALSLALALFGFLLGVGALGQADVAGFAVCLFGVLLAFIGWNRMWGSLVEFLGP